MNPNADMVQINLDSKFRDNSLYHIDYFELRYQVHKKVTKP